MRDAERLGAEEKLRADEAAQVSKISLQAEPLKVELRGAKNRSRVEISGAAGRQCSAEKS